MLDMKMSVEELNLSTGPQYAHHFKTLKVLPSGQVINIDLVQISERSCPTRKMQRSARTELEAHIGEPDVPVS